MAAAAMAEDAPAKDAGKKGGRKKLALAAAPVLLLAAGAGLWFTGIVPGMLGMGRKPAASEAELAHAAPVFVELPEMIANLNSPGRRPSYVKLKARLQLGKAGDQAAFAAAEPRVVDLFQTYLREMRPEELRSSSGTYRLREELLARSNLASAPAQVVDVLFSELLVQ